MKATAGIAAMLLVSAATLHAQDEVRKGKTPFLADHDKAAARAKEENKLLIVHFWALW